MPGFEKFQQGVDALLCRGLRVARRIGTNADVEAFEELCNGHRASVRFFYDVGGDPLTLHAFMLDLDARFARARDLMAHMQHSGVS